MTPMLLIITTFLMLWQQIYCLFNKLEDLCWRVVPWAQEKKLALTTWNDSGCISCHDKYLRKK